MKMSLSKHMALGVSGFPGRNVIRKNRMASVSDMQHAIPWNLIK